MTDEKSVRVEHQDGITRITINRPKVLNALNGATLTELEAAIDAIDPATTRVVVVTGAGEKAFVAGADIGAMAKLSAQEAADFALLGHRTFQKLADLPVPTIAAVNGFALGGGCELMLACDFAIASEKARIGLPEVSLGVIPGFAGTVRLGRRVGHAMAKQMLFTAQHVKADEALRIGLVNEVTAPEALLERVEAIAKMIAKNAPRAVQWAKASANNASDANLRAAGDYERAAFGMTFSTDDQKEGMAAFLEKRQANWKGC